MNEKTSTAAVILYNRPRKDRLGKASAALALFAFAILYAPSAQADTFGSGANQFDIEFVPIGNPDNPDDTTGDPNPAGKVEYDYRMGKFEISRDMITKANNEGGLGITMEDLTPFGGNRADRPATGVSWNEAAQFVNWLNTSTGHTPAYKFNGGTFQLWQSRDAGYDPINPFRNTQAFYFLPSADEWYKAAYYDPNAGVYYDYPTGSDSAPTAVASGTTADTAVYDQFSPLGPADITLAGGLSPYGTMGQGGNATEWEETSFDLANDSAISGRGLRGGSWIEHSGNLLASNRTVEIPSRELLVTGFRVAGIPEPGAMLLGALAAGGWLLQRGSRRRPSRVHVQPNDEGSVPDREQRWLPFMSFAVPDGP
jgi:formylglycine-generating enzyme required for sulfatase activity